MKIKELQELRNTLILDMKAIVDDEKGFDLAQFDAKEVELKEVENKIESLEKVEKLTQIENKVEKAGTDMNEFKNKLMAGQEVNVDFKNAMTTTNVKLEKVGNGSAVVEKAQENPILNHVRMHYVNGTEIVPVQKTKLDKLYRAAELTEIQKGGTLFETVELRPEKLSVIVPVSEELLGSEAYDVEQVITEEARQAIDNTLAELVITGDEKSFGLEKATKVDGAIEITRTTANALTLDDVNKLYFGLDPKFRKTAVWVMNDQDLALLVTLQDSTGRPIIHSDLARGFDFVLYGRPIVVSNDATKMYFTDLSQSMVAASGQSALIQKYTEAMMNVGAIAFRITSYADVKPAIQKAIAYMA